MPANGQVIEEMVKNYKTYLDLSICKYILFKYINQMIYTYFKTNILNKNIYLNIQLNIFQIRGYMH